jgi:hypothetical protein
MTADDATGAPATGPAARVMTRWRSFPVPWGALLLAALAFVLYSAVSLLRQRQLQTGFDLTIFDQLAQQYSRLEPPYLLVKSQLPFNQLGDHFSPILVVLAPFYRLWPSADMLLVAQALLVALAVFLITRFAVHRLDRTGYLFGALFALSFGVIRVIAFDFHEVAFAVPLMVLAVVDLVEGRHRRLLIWVVLLLAVKEDSALLVVGLGLALVLRRRFAWGWSLVAVGVAWFVVITQVVIPALSFNGRYTYFGSLGGGGGPLGILRTAAGSLFSWQGLLFLLALAAMAGLGLLSPLMIIVVPTVLTRFLSSTGTYTSIDYHYNGTLMVVCVVAAVEVVGRWQADPWGRRRWLLRGQYGLAVAMAVFGVAASPVPLTLGLGVVGCDRCDASRAVLEAVPDGVRVIADVYLMPQLVDRTQVMEARPSWTDWTDQPLVADWVVLNLSSRYDDDPSWAVERERLLEESGYVPIAADGDVIVLHRG